jgi:hypothetical protein
MNLLNFLRTKKQSPAASLSDSNTLSNNSILPNVDRALFLDENEPETFITSDTKSTALDQFLEQNYESMGYKDGYAYPENEYLENKIKLMKAEFKFAVDKHLDSLRSEVAELKIHIIKTHGISDRLEAQLNEKVKHHEMNIHELDMQKILSTDDEGFISSTVYAYRLGFIKGVEKYQQEKLFIGNTGLFNQ